MSTELTEDPFELIGLAIQRVSGLGLRSVEHSADHYRWERRSAQIWYRIDAGLVPETTNQVRIVTGLVVPLIDRVVPGSVSDFTVGGNLLRLSGSHATSFELQPGGRRGKIVARLRAPVFGGGETHSVAEGQPFVDDVTALLTSAFAPLVELTSWEQLAQFLHGHGADLSAKGAGPADVLGRQGILRWASGEQDAGIRLIRAGFAPAVAEEVLIRLAERFRPAASG